MLICRSKFCRRIVFCSTWQAYLRCKPGVSYLKGKNKENKLPYVLGNAGCDTRPGGSMMILSGVSERVLLWHAICRKLFDFESTSRVSPPRFLVESCEDGLWSPGSAMKMVGVGYKYDDNDGCQHVDGNIRSSQRRFSTKHFDTQQVNIPHRKMVHGIPCLRQRITNPKRNLIVFSPARRQPIGVSS